MTCVLMGKVTTRFSTYDSLLMRAEQRKRATVHFSLMRKARNALKVAFLFIMIYLY